MRKTMKSFAVMTLLLLCAAPLAAQDRNIHLTVFVSQVDMEGENDLDGFETEFDDGKALGAAVNLGVGRWFSVEAAAFGIRTEGVLTFDDVRIADLGNFNLTPLMLGVQFHPLSGRFDPYVGAGGAYVIGDDFFTPDLDLAGVGRIELESEVTYYLNAGIAFQITEGFGLILDGRQIQYEPSSQSSVTGVEQDLDLSPRILSAGLRLRF
jgi:outer membrane protein W